MGENLPNDNSMYFPVIGRRNSLQGEANLFKPKAAVSLDSFSIFIRPLTLILHKRCIDSLLVTLHSKLFILLKMTSTGNENASFRIKLQLQHFSGIKRRVSIPFESSGAL